MRNTSVLFCLLGILCLTTGFVGYMAHTFSSTTSELNGIRLVKADNARKELADNDKVCFVSRVFADDAIEMPDNHQKVVKGSLCLYALWPDGSKSIILNWNRKANYIRVSDTDSLPGEAIVPLSMECISDTASTAQRLRISRSQNSVMVEYYQTRSKLDGCYSKGQPQIILQREVLENGAKTAITLQRNGGENGNASVQSVVPYQKAIAKDGGMSKAKTFYLILAIAGVAMLFVPETKTINTITSIKLIGSKIIQKPK